MLKHRKTDSFGSFVAWGVGLEYEYDIHRATLGVLDPRRKTSLLRIQSCPYLLNNPLEYITTLDKVAQIQALVVSNKRNTNLSGIYHGARLGAMLENSMILANYACDLKAEKFERFENRFCEEYALKKVHLEKFPGSAAAPGFYTAELKTRNNNSIRTSSNELYRTIKELSERTIRDLATTEYTHSFQQSAQNLLTVSSNLSIISKTIDAHYVPVHKIIGTRTRFLDMKNNFSQKNHFKTIR